MSSRRVSHLRKWLLSSPPAEWALNQLRELLIGALQQGPIPKHVAFVMDGNRRFAKSHRMETVEGHNLGFEALAKILEVCYKSGVTHVTIYAFSIENFKRSKYEVDALMEIAKIKAKQLVQHGDLLDRYGARVRILGQRELMKPDVLEAIDRAVEMTSHNDKCVLNVCFPYTSREEITTAIRSTVEEYSKPIIQSSPGRGHNSPFKEERIANTIRSQHLSDHTKSQQTHSNDPPSLGVSSPSLSSTSLSSASQDQSEHEHEQDISSLSTSTTLHQSDHSPFSSSPKYQTSASNPGSVYLSPENINPQTLSEHMYTGSDPPIDLLVRTSGVCRLSDFMLWQCHQDTQIVFLNVLWPDFDLWSFLPVLWEWQWRIRKERRNAEEEESKSRDRARGGAGLSEIRANIRAQDKKLAGLL